MKSLTLPLESLVNRIRGEFREMPGLRLTFAQACRLWQMDVPTCDAIVQALIAEGFLARTPNGMFVALPMPRTAGSLPVKSPADPALVVSRRRQNA